MYFVTLLVLVILELLAWRQYHDVKCPAFLFGILWLTALINIRTMSLYDEVTDSALLLITIGSIVFHIGVYLGIHIKIDKRVYTITANNQAMKWLIVVLAIIAVPVIVEYITFIRFYGGSLYSAIRSARVDLELPALFDYYRKAAQFLFLSFAIVYWKEPLEKRKSMKGYVVVLFIIASMATISVPTRNSLLFFFLPLVMCWYCTHNTSNKRIVFTMFFSAIGFLFAFYIISTGKYWYLYAAVGANRFEVIKNEIQTYLSGSIASFSATWKTHSFTRFGGNTFRFFVALYDAMAGTKLAVPLVNDFLTFSNGIKTNVYTIYDYYLRDFGIIYAFLIQGFFAVIHGVNYRKMKTGNLFSIYFYAMLSYPLIMQFFQDQYISLLSTWVQIIIVGALVLKSNVFFSKDYTK